MRDDQAIGWIAITVYAVLGLIGAVVAAGGILYATDYGLEANVIDTDCKGSSVFGGGGSDSAVTVKTKMFGIEHTVTGFDNDQCRVLEQNSDDEFVRYHVRSGHTILWKYEGGPCIYDSEKGFPC